MKLPPAALVHPAMSMCEWNPATSEPAKTGDPGHAEAVLRVGSRRSWHLCQACADLPEFKRLRVRKPLQKPAGRKPKLGDLHAPDPLDGLPTEAELAQINADNAARRATMLEAAGGRPVAFDCETAGKSLCWACAIDGPHRCLEDHLPPEVHATCVTEAHRLYLARGKGPCHDCASRRGSPEREQEGALDKLVRQRDPFRCHQAMPLDGRGRTPAEGDYAPDDHARYPVCAGWARARESYLARRAAARALPSLRAKVAKPARVRIVAALGLPRFGRPRRRARVRELARIVPPSLGLWCTTRRRQALRSELAIVQQRLVSRGFRIVGELHRRQVGAQVEHRIAGDIGQTPWIVGEATAALDAFAVVLVRAGVRAGLGGGGDKPPPYTRPPKKPQPPRPRSKRPGREPAKTLVLRAA